MGAGLATAGSQSLSLIVGLIFMVWENWLQLIPVVDRQIFQLSQLRTLVNLNRDFFVLNLDIPLLI